MATGRDVTATCGGRSALEDFGDIGANVHRSMIECISHYAITQGKRDGVYGAKDPLTRGQIATFLVRTLESAGWALPGGTGQCSGPVHGDSLDSLVAAGIMGRNACDLSTQMTRTGMAQATAAAIRWAQAGSPSPIDYFIDDGHLAASTQRSHDMLAHQGVVIGTAPGFFSPDRLLQRDQMATFLARLLDLLSTV